MSVMEGSSSGFIVRLEALRGVAALWVAVGHSMIWLVIGSEPAIWSKSLFDVHGVQANIARAIITVFSGASAVDIFFVLSGFVLARALRGFRLSADGYVRFAVKRLFRIIPAFWASLLLVVLYLSVAYPGFAKLAGASPWFDNWYKDPLTLHALAENVAFVSPMLNPNAWTLKVEILASLLLPLIVWGMAPRGARRSAIIFLFALALAWIYRSEASGLPHFLYMFVAGAIVAKHGAPNAPRMMGDGAFVLVCLAAIISASAFFPLVHPFAADLLVVFGSTGLVWAISSGRDTKVLRLLDARWTRALGRVSYSFYLLHFIALYAIANLMMRTIPATVITRWPLLVMMAGCVLSIAITIPIASLSFRYIEKPFTVFGRRFGAAQSKLVEQ
ncbi:acyltransferase [Caballeronia peredens]|nr:acyltransferase [Caballeronia peredens]